ncbi:unnamed protein product, partial [Pylaiella littoralis]
SDIGVGQECAICMTDMLTSDKRCLVGCGNTHVFHSKCIGKWMRRSGTCPVCRQDMGRCTTINAPRR